jgi:predicted ATPase
MSIDARCLQRLRDAANAAGERLHTNWRVVTGAPFSGKTTLVESLRSRGYRTIEDCGRRAICERLSSGQTKDDARSDYESLQLRISELMLDKAGAHDPSTTVIWDYSFPDNLAYLAIAGHEWDDIHLERAVRFRFKQVFLLHTVGRFNNLTDPVRTESQESQVKLQTIMKEIYETLGAEVIEIPASTLDFRLAEVEEILAR